MTSTIWALGLRDMSPQAKLIAIALADYFDEKKESGRPVALTDLAEFACCDVADVAESLLGDLAAAGVTFVDHGTHIAPILPVQSARRHTEPLPDPPYEIYVIASAKGGVKIGISGSAKTRLRQLQFIVPAELRLVWSKRATRGIIRSVEAEVHAALAAQRITGEWFDVTPERALEVVREKLAAYGII